MTILYYDYYVCKSGPEDNANNNDLSDVHVAETLRIQNDSYENPRKYIS